MGATRVVELVHLSRPAWSIGFPLAGVVANISEDLSQGQGKSTLYLRERPVWP